MTAASIRYKNPGAMWGSALTKKWGADPNAITLHDGKGQGNNIAVFPTFVQGICAQIDLWRTSAHYKNKPFAVGIATWSGGNSVESYVRLVTKRVPGMTRDTVMDDAFWHSGMAIPFLKAQAFHEAGQEYPAPEGDWAEALHRVCGVSLSEPHKTPDTQERKPSAIPEVSTTTTPQKTHASDETGSTSSSRPVTKPLSKPVVPVLVGTVTLPLFVWFQEYRWEIVLAGMAVALGVFLWTKFKGSRKNTSGTGTVQSPPSVLEPKDDYTNDPGPHTPGTTATTSTMTASTIDTETVP